MSDDRLLVKRLLAGEEPAFEEFFEDFFPRLFRFALPRLNHNEDLAEEVVQATLCAAMTKIGTFRGEAALFTWLCTICRREMEACQRRFGREVQPLFPDDSPEVRASLESLAASLSEQPDSPLLKAEVARLVQVALDCLPRWHARALEMKYLEDLPVKEIAVKLNLGPKAAESLLTRARQAFRECFSALVRTEARYEHPGD